MRFSLIILLTAFLFSMPAEARVGRTYTGQLNVNTASAADLTRLPGIGEVIAFRIVKERERRGVFRKVAELRDVKGVSARIYEGIRSYVTVKGDSSLKVYMDLNTITNPLLLGIPGMTKEEACSILNYRKANGRFGKIEELKLVPGITEKRFTELSEWVTVVR